MKLPALLLLFQFAKISLVGHPINNGTALKFEHIGAAQGFYPTSISSNMVQDNTGFIWIGTDDGLYRYDGNEFRIFTGNPVSKSSLPNKEITCLYASDHNILWIGSVSGLICYDPVKESFTPFKTSDSGFAFLSTAPIKSISSDRHDNLCVFSDGKLVAIQTASHQMKLILKIPGLAYPYIDRSGNTWVGSDGSGLYRVDHATQKIKVYHHNPDNPQSISVDNIFSVTEDPEGNIWCATTSGLCRLDTASENFTRFMHDDFKPDDPTSGTLGSNFINGGVYTDWHGTVWAGTYAGGLHRFMPGTGTFLKYKNDPSNPYSLGCNSISNVFVDKSNVLWVATDGGGLYKAYLGKENYRIYAPTTQRSETSGIRHVYCDHRGLIWMAWYGQDTYSLDPATGKFRAWLTDPKDVKLRYCMTPATGYYDAGNFLYIIAVYEGLLQLNMENGKAVILHSNFLIPEKVKDYTNYFTIVSDSTGRLWIGGQKGISIYDPATKKLHAYRELFKDTNQLNNDAIFLQYLDGYIWSLGAVGGLTRIDPHSGQVKIYKHRDGDATSIGSDNLMQMAKDKNNLIWIGTVGSGLCLLNPANGQFRTFTTENGIPGITINGLLIDNCNNVWITTNRGISRCSYPQDVSPFVAKLTVRNYDFGDKAGSNTNGSVYCTKGLDGTFYFASQGGLLAFHPDSLEDNPFIPPVVITELLLSNKNTAPADTMPRYSMSITFTNEIKLSYEENIIAFKFAALNYNHPEKNRYAYMLEGFDKDWIYTDASRRFANYTNLDAGEYIFKVKGSNNDGVWNEKPTELRLIITPPFWKTGWFRMMVAAGIGGLFYALYRYRLQQVIKLQVIRNNIASDLHDDIGSTLNSISIFSEVAKQQAGQSIPALDEIGKSSRKIIDAMSDIVWTINPENDSFEKIIIRMRSFAYNLLKAKKIEMAFKTDPALTKLTLPMLVRKNFYLIFKEATNNLVKYSKASKVLYQLTYSNKQIHLEIRDNGSGFDTREARQGNGIKNMNKRAREIHAEIIIEAAPGKGTRIELILKT